MPEGLLPDVSIALLDVLEKSVEGRGGKGRQLLTGVFAKFVEEARRDSAKAAGDMFSSPEGKRIVVERAFAEVLKEAGLSRSEELFKAEGDLQLGRDAEEVARERAAAEKQARDELREQRAGGEEKPGSRRITRKETKRLFSTVKNWLGRKFAKNIRILTDAEMRARIGALQQRVGATESAALRAEKAAIVERAKADGTYMQAPNGKPTKLSAEQWATVRTKAFKGWFGDWEKAARIEKLKKAPTVELTGYTGQYELNREAARAWIKANLEKKSFTIADTGEVVRIGKAGRNKLTSHSYSNEAHLKSIASVPQMLANATFVEEQVNEKANGQYPSFRYYVSGVKIDGEAYTAKIVVGKAADGSLYYDHSLTTIEKGVLAKLALEKQTPDTNNGQDALSSAVKDTRLLSLLQVNSSKAVDENGEPLVVYHQTNNTQYVNKETGEIWDNLNWQEKQEWEARDDWSQYWEERDFYTFDNKNYGRRSIEMPAFFFSPQYDEYHEYGRRTISAFLNIKNPATNPEIPNAGVTDTAGENAMNELINQGYDGFIRMYDGAVNEINAFAPNQIKSATDNAGTFDAGNADIRFQKDSRHWLRDANGEVMGWFDAESGEVAIRENARVDTFLHELFWHGTWAWAKENAPELYGKLTAYARNAPEAVKAEVRRNYPELEEGSETWLNEVGAAAVGAAQSGKMEQLLKSAAEKSWWTRFKNFFRRVWREMVSALGGNRVNKAAMASLNYEDAVEALARDFAAGKTLADYAVRVRERAETLYQKASEVRKT